MKPEEGAAHLRGRVVGLLADRVHVPRELRAPLAPFLPRERSREALEREREEPERAWPAPAPPRYRATLAFGRRREPWLVRVTAIETPPVGADP